MSEFRPSWIPGNVSESPRAALKTRRLRKSARLHLPLISAQTKGKLAAGASITRTQRARLPAGAIHGEHPPASASGHPMQQVFFQGISRLASNV